MSAKLEFEAWAKPRGQHALLAEDSCDQEGHRDGDGKQPHNEPITMGIAKSKTTALA